MFRSIPSGGGGYRSHLRKVTCMTYAGLPARDVCQPQSHNSSFLLRLSYSTPTLTLTLILTLLYHTHNGTRWRIRRTRRAQRKRWARHARRRRAKVQRKQSPIDPSDLLQMNMLWNNQVADTCVVFRSWHISNLGGMFISWYDSATRVEFVVLTFYLAWRLLPFQSDTRPSSRVHAGTSGLWPPSWRRSPVSRPHTVRLRLTSRASSACE
jgi:hypothetical protein